MRRTPRRKAAPVAETGEASTSPTPLRSGDGSASPTPLRSGDGSASPTPLRSGDGSASFYSPVFTPEERAEVEQWLLHPSGSMEVEVAMLRLLIRRVLERIGADDPVKALPLVRQGVDTLCRAMRTQRLLEGESADSLAAAFATALREIGEELGVGE